MLERHIIKQALLDATRLLAQQADLASKREEVASRRANKLQLVNDLIDNSRMSRLSAGLTGAARGAVMMGLPLIAPSLYYKTPAWALGGAAVGAAGGGYLGSKIPQWSEETLKSYAKGKRDPVYYDRSGEVVSQPLSQKERSLVSRAMQRGHRG